MRALSIANPRDFGFQAEQFV